MNEMVRAQESSVALLERVIVGGDLSKLQPAERLTYYADVCRSVGLNPLTKPFEYITLNNKLTLYAKRDATDQLRAIKGISIQIVGRDLVGDIYVVTARATSHGREDESTGAVSITGLKGADLANAYMKAETKAKRRVTLSIAGLGMLDESEVGDIDPTTATTERPAVQMPRAKGESKSKKQEPGSEQQPAGAINATQLSIVRKTLERSGKQEAALCEHFGIKALEELPGSAEKVNEALDWAKGE